MESQTYNLDINFKVLANDVTLAMLGYSASTLSRLIDLIMRLIQSAKNQIIIGRVNFINDNLFGHTSLYLV